MAAIAAPRGIRGMGSRFTRLKSTIGFSSTRGLLLCSGHTTIACRLDEPEHDVLASNCHHCSSGVQISLRCRSPGSPVQVLPE